VPFLHFDSGCGTAKMAQNMESNQKENCIKMFQFNSRPGQPHPLSRSKWGIEHFQGQAVKNFRGFYKSVVEKK